MLKTKHPDRGDVIADNVASLELDADDPHDIDWRCTVADCKMQFVDAERRIKHFRHYEKADHVSPAESEEHRALILALKNHYENQSHIESVFVEEYIEEIDRIADVLLVKTNGDAIVVEAQLSSQPKQKFIRRTRDYDSLGFYTLWLLGVENYLNEKSTKNTSGYRYTDVHQWMKTQYYGRHYTTTMGFNELVIDGMRYERKQGRSYGRYGGVGDYKTIASMQPHPIPRDQLEPIPQDKSGDYYDDLAEFKVATFGEDPWW